MIGSMHSPRGQGRHVVALRDHCCDPARGDASFVGRTSKVVVRGAADSVARSQLVSRNAREAAGRIRT